MENINIIMNTYVNKHKMVDVTNDLIIEETEGDVDNKIITLNYKYQTELIYEKIKIKFNNALIKYLSNMKNDIDYYCHVYESFFTLWKRMAMDGNNLHLFILLKYLTKSDAYNIKKTIFDMVTNEKLNDELYFRFISDFSEL